MSTPIVRITMLGLVLAAALAAPTAMAAETAFETRLDTYATADGTGYFALRLVPNVAAPQAAGQDIIVLFDTSATQAGTVRDKGIEALESMLAVLPRGDRVQLMAADLDAVALSPGFVEPQSEPMKKAIQALRERPPLGATDMPLVLTAAADAFEKTSPSARAIIYIGDGMSTAQFLSLEDYRALVKTLVEQREAVSSYAVGVRTDTQLLASLANQTGGMLAIDGESVEPKQAGVFLASAARGTVFWPAKTAWPKQFAEVYPQPVPPLRSDRDTVVVGMGTLQGDQKISLAVEVGGKPRQLEWAVSPAAANADFAFLTLLVESARLDGGVAAGDAGHAGPERSAQAAGRGDGSPGPAWQPGHCHGQPGNRRTADRRSLAPRSHGSDGAGRAETTCQVAQRRAGARERLAREKIPERAGRAAAARGRR